MSFFRRFFFLIFLNILIVISASIVATLVMGYFGFQGDLPFYLIFYSLIGFGGAFFSLYISKWSAKKWMGVRIIDPNRSTGEEKELLEAVYEMARAARLPKMPEVGVYESQEMNAFATGPSKRNSLVAVSRGLLNRTNKEELRGVLGHEVAHIANGDMVTMTLLMGVVNTMVLLAARLVARLITSQMRNRSFWVEHLIFIGLQMVFMVFGSMLLGFFSRKREYRADAGGARYAGAGSMIRALKALRRATGFTGPEETVPAQESYGYLQISGKPKKSSLASLLSTHPPLEDRIARLERQHQ